MNCGARTLDPAVAGYKAFFKVRAAWDAFDGDDHSAEYKVLESALDSATAALTTTPIASDAAALAALQFLRDWHVTDATESAIYGRLMLYFRGRADATQAPVPGDQALSICDDIDRAYAGLENLRGAIAYLSALALLPLVPILNAEAAARALAVAARCGGRASTEKIAADILRNVESYVRLCRCPRVG